MKKYLLLSYALFVVSSLAAQETKLSINQLDFLPGRWNVDVDSRLSAQGPWEKTKAVSVIRKSLKETLIEEEFTGTRQGKPFLAKSLFGINNGTNQFQRLFADSEHGVLVLYEGEKKGDTLHLDKTWTYANGNAVKLRVAYYTVSPTEFKVETMRMPQGANAWDVTGRMHYKRAD